MSFHPGQFRDILREILVPANLYSEAAEELLFGTAAQESLLGHYLRQYPEGPANGIFQIEEGTERDLWKNYLYFRPGYIETINFITGVCDYDHTQMRTNLGYQILAARFQYLRVPRPLPDPKNVPSMAVYWKLYWNTLEGKGRPNEFVQNYLKFAGGEQ